MVTVQECGAWIQALELLEGLVAKGRREIEYRIQSQQLPAEAGSL